MLRISGFTIKDEPVQPSSSPRHEQSPYHQPGPRLSSVTPIPGLHTSHGPAAHSGWAFTSLLSSNVMPSSPLQPPLPAGPSRRDAQTQDGFAGLLASDAPDVFQPRVTADEASQLLNPYRLFLSKHSSDLHRPRVSSPLRNSFSPDGPITPNRGFGAYPAEANRNEPIAGHSPISRSRSSSVWRENRGYCVPGIPPSPHSRDSPTDLVQGGMPPTEFEKGVGHELHATSSFRDCMPQRRDLPFAQDKACAPRRSPSAGSGSPGDETYQGPRSPQGLPDDRVQLVKAHQDRQEKSRRTTSLPCVRDEAPFESTNTRDQNSMSQGGESLSLSKSPNPPQPLYYAPPAVVVADPLVIRRLDSMTSGLLEQYQADVSRGCDEGVCAQFYVERMQSCRREFWLSQLTGGKRQGTA